LLPIKELKRDPALKKKVPIITYQFVEPGPEDANELDRVFDMIFEEVMRRRKEKKSTAGNGHE